MKRNGFTQINNKIFKHPKAHDQDFIALWAWMCNEAVFASKDDDGNPNIIEVDFGGETIVLNPGQFTTGSKRLSEMSGVQVSKVDRLLKRMKSDGLIDKRTDRQCSLITIRNWHDYKIVDERNDKRMTNERRTDDERMTTKEDKKINKKTIKQPYSEQFEKFWSVYPVKNGKGGAFKIWKRDKLDGRVDEIVEAVEMYKKSQKVADGYTKNPETWLNKKCYDDEPDMFTAKSCNPIPTKLAVELPKDEW